MADVSLRRELGWHRMELRPDDLAARRAPHTIGRVMVEHRGSYEVACETGPVEASVTNQLRRAARRANEQADDRARERASDRSSERASAAFPAVGDWVTVTAEPTDDRRASITEVLPRRSVLMRSGRGRGGPDGAPRVLAANVDLVGVVTTAERAHCGADSPGADRLERLLVAAAVGGCRALVVVNKADLAEPDTDALAQRLGDTQLLVTSALSGRGVDALAALCVDGVTLCLVGASGVGKSSLVNALIGDASAQVAPLTADGRGRHTTTRRTLHVLAPGAPRSQPSAESERTGGTVVDTPGLQHVVPCATAGDPRRAAAELEAGLATVFADVTEVAGGCRFAHCAHDTEPDCAVTEAVALGTLSDQRVAALARLSAELLDD